MTQAVLPPDVWLTKFELSRKLPTDASSQNQNSDDGNIFGSSVNSDSSSQQPQDYVSVAMTGYGLVRNRDFYETFLNRVVNSQYFEFGQKDRLPIKNSTSFRPNDFNIAEFQLTLKMKTVIKQ